MIIKDEELLLAFRSKYRCESCGASRPSGLDPHHACVTRGMGGGSRLDIAINLIALCRHCHTAHHAGKNPGRSRLLEIIAWREKCTVEYIEAECDRILALDKDAVYERVME